MPYHTVVLPSDSASANRVDGIRQLVLDNNSRGTFGWIVSDNDPSANVFLQPFPANRWCQRVSAFSATDGPSLANAVAVALWGGRDRVAIDEINTNQTVNQKVKGAADILGTNPTFWRRFGAYVIRAGSVNVLTDCQPAIDSMLAATGSILYEAYVKHSTWCNNGTTVGAHDVWLGSYFNERMNYFAARRAAVSYPGWPPSFMSPIFGVTDIPGSDPDLNLLNCTDKHAFLDRMFYVWRTRSGYAGTLNEGEGGAGSYRWEIASVSSSSRDNFFRDSWNHYCRDMNNTSRVAQPGCGGCT